MAGKDPAAADRSTLLQLGGGLIERDISYIQGELGDCTCSGERLKKGEPWASLSASLSPDSRRENRRAYAAKGEGLLLKDIADVAKKLGSCSCSGRKK